MSDLKITSPGVRTSNTSTLSATSFSSPPPASSPPPKATFSISSDEDLPKSPGGAGHGATRRRSTDQARFKVEFVDSTTTLGGDEGGVQRVSMDDKSPPPPQYSRYSVTDAYDVEGESSKDYTVLHTIETLPHEDHYRDLLPATAAGGGMRKRPTLVELHELDLEEAMEGGKQTEVGENGDVVQQPGDKSAAVGPDGKKVKAAPKFGWIIGVFVRCLLNIFGVMLFLRITWVVGQAGIGYGTLIILVASTVTTLTGLSMSAISTNGEVKGGGAYYMISRALGPEFGGAIGIIFALANAFAVAMYVIGFAETIRDLLRDNGMIIVDDLNDVRIIGFIAATVLLAIAIAGLDWEARAQLVLLAILSAAILNVMIGTFLPPSDQKKAEGFTGYSVEHFKDNFVPDFRGDHGFFSVFAIFFPAATGILAGANISGDLKDAQKAIPKGTMLAIFLTTLVYLAIAWMAGLCMERDASGIVAWIASNATEATGLMWTVTESVPAGSVEMTATTAAAAAAVTVCVPGNVTAGSCDFGLHNSMRVTQLLSIYAPITIAGIVSATLSSALASLISAPKVFQAVCKDNIFPYIAWFGKGYGRGGEPRRAYFLTFAIGACCIIIGDLNQIAPLISNFFLMSYGIICFACADASLAKSPGWRPAFKYYSIWTSLAGTVLCIVVMFIMNWWTALITMALVAILYFYVHYRKPDINWGSSAQAHVYKNALQHTQKLNSVLEHIKNFRPQLLVLTAMPNDRPALVDLCNSISKSISLMVCGHVLLPEDDIEDWQSCGGLSSVDSAGYSTPGRRQSHIDPVIARRMSTASFLHVTASSVHIPGEVEPMGELRDMRYITSAACQWLHKRKVKSFYNVMSATTLRLGVQAMMQTVGLGKLRPNVLIIGFKSNWKTSSHEEVEDYFNIIHDAFDLNYGVGIMRLREGLDCSHLIQHPTQHNADTSTSSLHTSTISMNISMSTTGGGGKTPGSLPGVYDSPLGGTYKEKQDDSKTYHNPAHGGAESDSEAEEEESIDHHRSTVKPGVSEEELKNMLRFHRKKQTGTVDVWWLFDDGGLTLLIPYLLTTKKLWSSCKLRVYMATSKKTEAELDQEHRHMATLLAKFRIEYSTITLISDIGKTPEFGNLKEFDMLVNEWTLRKSDGETQETHPWKITDEELTSQREKIYRHVRLHELLKQHSWNSTLIVVTLPMPRKGMCSAGLYMAWIDTISKDLPPLLLLRGNQESVLTYYS